MWHRLDLAVLLFGLGSFAGRRHVLGDLSLYLQLPLPLPLQLSSPAPAAAPAPDTGPAPAAPAPAPAWRNVTERVVSHPDA